MAMDIRVPAVTIQRQAAEVDPLLHWQTDLVDALWGVTLEGEPMRTRHALRESARAWARQAGSLPVRFAVVAFGSVARVEPSNDLDLIVVDADATRGHRYVRLTRGERHVDVNVVSESWLRKAWADIEYGYWLNESYVLAANDAALVSTWKRSCNLYWSPAGVARRADTHRAMTLQLLAARSRAHDAGWALIGRFLGHEAARAAACAIIDRHGSRVFSHRTLVAEVVAATAEAALPAAATAALLAALAADKCDRESGFVCLRRDVSRLLRDPVVGAVLDYDAAEPRTVRVSALCRSADGSAGSAFTEALTGAGLDERLPTAAQLEGLPAAVATLLQRLAPACAVPSLQPTRLLEAPTPGRGNLPGARWVEWEGGRLKIIVNTGGCKTPSCAFCALPAFGRGAPRADVAGTLVAALDRHRPRDLALYNDGNLLNPREVSQTELRAVCDAIQRHRVARLTIESIPRFVDRGVVGEVRIRSGVGRLVVALGLQAVGNAFAIQRLGRPDVDALFEFAIDEVHDAGAEVRLYLLWGFEPVALETRRERLARSISWAQARGVETVSVCPYRSPLHAEPARDAAAPLDDLHAIVRSLAPAHGTTIEIVGSGLASCALQRGAQ